MAKSRLGEVLDRSERRTLAMICAAHVLDRRVACERIVVCDDDAVEAWSRHLGATCVRVTSTGLNESLSEALPVIVSLHPNSAIVIAHGDIADPRRLDDLLMGTTDIADESAVVIVPDRHHDGTNVLRLSSRVVREWRFEYGPGSFERHVLQAHSRGWSLVVHEEPGLAIDLDTPEDLALPYVRSFLTEYFPALRLPPTSIDESNHESRQETESP